MFVFLKMIKTLEYIFYFILFIMQNICIIQSIPIFIQKDWAPRDISPVSSDL